MSEEKIESNCPECGTPNLFFKGSTICCSQCDKVIFTEATKEKAIDSLTDWVKENQAALNK